MITIFAYPQTQVQDKAFFTELLHTYHVRHVIVYLPFKSDEELVEEWYHLIALFIHSDWTAKPVQLIFSPSVTNDTVIGTSNSLWNSLRADNVMPVRDYVYYATPYATTLEKRFLGNRVNELFDDMEDLVQTVLT